MPKYLPVTLLCPPPVPFWLGIPNPEGPTLHLWGVLNSVLCRDNHMS